jgi:aminoglycoside phosphotransferase (APT) family kinase protein
MSATIDETIPVRPGEELPCERLEAYLAEHLPKVRGPLSVQQFPHGHSNLTYLLHLGQTDLVLRRPPFGNQVKTAHDMGREYRVLSRLWEVYPPAPRPYLYCEDTSVLGSPFYIMECRRGLILRGKSPAALELGVDAVRQLGLALVDNLAQIHTLDYRAIGLGDLGKPEGYVARQVGGWSKRYRDAQTEDVPAMEHLAQWLNTNMPPESSANLVHNDYKFDNVVFDPADPSHVLAVLDWEMATVGDPLMDLGTMLGYWIEAADPEPFSRSVIGPTNIPGSLTRREIVERYADKTSRDVSGALFYYCFGLFKIAVIIQQIYVRYVRGHTRDERFASLNQRVQATSEAAVRALEQGKL